MMSEKERENREELFELIKDNPDLPIVPMVDYEIAAEDSGRWLGSWGSSYIGEYLVGEERVHFREDDDPYEVARTVEEELDNEAWGVMSDEEWIYNLSITIGSGWERRNSIDG